MKKSKPKKHYDCGLICWSLKGKDGKIRQEVCPECGKAAEVGLDMIGRPCFFHKREKIA